MSPQPVLRLLVLTVPVCFVWQMAQAAAFTGMPEGLWAGTAVCALATLGDAVLVLLLRGIGALVSQDPRWFVAPTWAKCPC